MLAFIAAMTVIFCVKDAMPDTLIQYTLGAGGVEARTEKDRYDQLLQLVRAFARAAEQLYHDVDPSGEARNRFVLEQLTALDIEITEAVLNMIEGAVWEINTETKKAQVQDRAISAGGVSNGNA